MYFGYGQMWTFTFVPAGFLLVVGYAVALGLVYFVGASGGRSKARRYTDAVSYAIIGLSVIDLAYGALSGQLGSFLRAYGWVPLAEMSVMAFMFIGSMWFMASAYVRSKQEE